MHLLFCFSTFFVFLLVNTCLADSTIPTDEPLAGFLSNLDPSLGVAKPNGGTNSDNLFMSNTPNSDSTTLGSEVPIINDKFDSALFGNSPGSTDISNNDDPGLDLWATTGESCVPDSTHHVNKRNEACSPKDAGAVLGGQDKPTQQGVLTGEAIEQLFKTLAYGLDLHTEDDYTWCGGTKYAVCDSGYEFDRVLRLPPLFALYDCSHCKFSPRSW